MRPPPVFLATLALIGAMLLAFYGISSLSSLEPRSDGRQTTDASTQLPPLDEPTVSFGNPMRGAKDAPLTIVEFGDFFCQACADLHPALTKILEEFPGKTRIVWKDFPNEDAHPGSGDAAVAARCAGYQGTFWEYHDLLFANQASVKETGYGALAAQLGLNLNEFDACLEEKRSQPLVDRDLEEGLRLLIDGTPYLFVGDRRVSGAVTYEQLKELVATALIAVKSPAK